MNVEEIVFPELRAAGVRRLGAYSEVAGETFGRLFSWASRNAVFNDSSLVIGVYYDCPETTPPDKCRMDACVTLSEGQNPPLEDGIAIQTLPGGLCASRLCNVYNNDFKGAWKEFDRWLAEHNTIRDQRPCYEIYYGPKACTHPLKKWVLDIVIPLKQHII